MVADWQDGQAERDAAIMRFRAERQWEQEQASKRPGEWAALARQRMADASPVAAEVIEHGLAEGVKSWQLMERARLQADESRAERLAGLDSAATAGHRPT